MADPPFELVVISLAGIVIALVLPLGKIGFTRGDATGAVAFVVFILVFPTAVTMILACLFRMWRDRRED